MELTVVWGKITDNDDGTAILTIGVTGWTGGTFGGADGFATDGMVPYYIPIAETFTVPLYKQGLWSMLIDVIGTLNVDGFLVEVD